MQGLRPPSFLATKKKLDVAGEVDGRMNPWFKASFMYSSMAVLSGIDNGLICPLGSLAPCSRSMQQSHGRCGGKCVAASLLNTSLNDWYSEGTCETWHVSGLSMVVEQIERLALLETGTGRFLRHLCLHPLSHLSISPDLQSMVGWYLASQGHPRTTSTTASSSTSREILSSWNHPIWRLTSGVWERISPLPSGFPWTVVIW